MDVHHDQKDRITTSLVHGGADAFSDDLDSSENNDSSDMEIISNPVPKQQQKRQTKSKKPAQQKSQPSNKRRVKPTDDDELDTDSTQYDPVTCGASTLYYHVLNFLTCLLVFKIPSLAKSTDGSNSPFVIESSITLKELCNTIAERLGRHPNVIQLRYKLANDKVKAPATSIRNENELEFFVERMRNLLVPQRLSNGKKSKRAPAKNSTVCFEDVAVVEAQGKMAEGSNGKGKKKV